MDIPITLFFVAFVSTYIAISVLRPFAISINLTDAPDNRKKHEGVVPLIGGIAMFVGLLISTLSSDFDLNIIKYFLLSSFVVVIIGALDDHKDLSVGFRFFFQVIVAIIVAAVADINLTTLGELIPKQEIFLGTWSIFFTIIAIVAAMNAVNMADGIHGLAGLNSFITLGSLSYLAYLGFNETNFIISFLICAVILPFLIHNLCLFQSNDKRIFMGDAGSMFLGLCIAWLLIDLSQSDSKAFKPVIALWLFAIPLIDTVSTVLRRLIFGKSPFRPDRNHLHHILINIGLSSNFVLFIICTMSLIMAGVGIYGSLLNISEWKMFVGFMIIFVGYFFISYVLIIRMNKK